MLKTEVEHLESNKVALKVEVPSEEVKTAYNNFYKSASRYVNIPGFRKGKIPRNVIAKYVGPEIIKEHVEEELLKKAYPEAVKEADLHPVGEYEIEESELTENAPYVFKAVFEVRPRIEELKYTGLSAKVTKEKVTDESVKKVLTQLQDQYSTNKVIEDGQVEDGDYITADVQVFCEGEKDNELSEENSTHRVSTEDRFYGACIGMKNGETKEYEVKIDSDDEKDSKYFGKTLNYKVKLISFSRPEKPGLDDEFAKKLGEFDTMEDLKKKIKSDLEQRSEEDAKARAHESIIDQLIESHPIDVPETMIQETIDFFIEGLDRRWQQYGTNIKDYLRNSNQDMDDFRESFRERAIKQAKTILFMDEIGKRENISVSDEDYRNEIDKRAGDYGMPVENLLEVLSKNDGESNVRFSLKTDKINDFLLTNNDVTYDIVEEAQNSEGE